MNAHSEIVAAVPQVYTAMSNIMTKMAKDGIAKDKRNQAQGYNFRGIDDIYAALCSVMAAEKLLILPFVQDIAREERQTAKGGLLIYTILTVDFTFVSAIDGSTCLARMKGEAMDSSDKSCNKAQSAALKYAALQVFMIPTEGDNDADATTHEVQPRQRQESTSSRKEDVAPPEGWGDWARGFLTEIAGTDTDKGLDALRDDNKARINASKKEDAAIYKAIGDAFTARRSILADKIPF